MLGMLRGWKSSWTVPAGTTAAGLAAGVAGVGARLCRVVLTGWLVLGTAVVTTGASLVPAGAAAFCRLS